MTDLCVLSHSPIPTPSTSKASPARRSAAIDAMKDIWDSRTRQHHDRLLCPNPTAVERRHFSEIGGSEWFASLKSDGVRYLTLLFMHDGEPCAVMIDRKLEVYEIEVWANLPFFENRTFIDGELLWDYTNEFQPCLVYLAFDIICDGGVKCIQSSYANRLLRLHNIICSLDSTYDPKDLEGLVEEQNRIAFVNNHFGMRLHPKKVLPAEHLPQLWQERQTCSHRNDGIVLTKNDAPLVAKTCSTMLKWKPSNTIDVLFKATCDVDYKVKEVCIASQGKLMPISGRFCFRNFDFKVEFVHNALVDCVIKTASGTLSDVQAILECRSTVTTDTIELFPLKERMDKGDPNDIHVVYNTIKNCVEKISIEELIDLVRKD